MHNFARTALTAAAMATAALAGGAAQAATLIVDVTGALSYGVRCNAANNECGPTNPNKNTVMLFDIGAFSQVTALAYNVSIEAVRGSYQQDMMFSLSDSSGGSRMGVRPGYLYGPGSGTYTGARDLLVAPMFDLYTGADGLLRIEFSDQTDDIRNGIDGRWRSGTITLTYQPVAAAVPEPATWAMMIVGFGAVGSMVRTSRRRNALSAA
jgi:hypothetical protein